MAENNTPVMEIEQDVHEQKRIRMEKLAERKANGMDPYTITKFDVTKKACEVKAEYEAAEAEIKAKAGDDEAALAAGLDALKENVISDAGRIMSKRVMGNALFIHIQDSTDRIQVYVRVNDIG